MSLAVGFSGKISKGGSPTTLTNEATTLVSGKTYQISNAAKRRLDPATAVVVKDNGSTVAASNISKVTALNGEVTFISSYTPTTPVTISGKYIPSSALAAVKNGMGTLSRESQDVTQVNNALGVVQRKQTVLDYKGKFDIYDLLVNQGLDVIFNAGTPFLFELDPDGSGASVERAWVLLTQTSGDIAGKMVNESPVDFVMLDRSDVATALSGFLVDASVVFGDT